MAIHALRKELREGEFMTIESILGTNFKCRYFHSENFGPYKAVIPEVHGNAYYTGVNQFIVENEDPLRDGFLLR